MNRIAILDLYEGQPNQGMRCLRDIVHHWSAENQLSVHLDEFDVRLKNEIPDLSYQIYISSGGPGSPFAGIGSEWEEAYFKWVRAIELHNSNSDEKDKKFVFFICHSFQLACRYFDIAQVTKRRSSAFGVYPVHMTPVGEKEPVFSGLNDPFYVVDSRKWQAVRPDLQRLDELGAQILCIEKERPHVPYERAVMAIRFDPYMVGTQFHPEADAKGMCVYLQKEEKKRSIIAEYGERKWRNMIDHLNDPDKIMWTYAHVLPNFLNHAIGKTRSAPL